MTWQRPGDKVQTLEQRLCSLENRTTQLTVATLALVLINLAQLGPTGAWFVHAVTTSGFVL